ncbi:lipoprotein signal peptidase II [Deferribacter desulfuricans SSM1]|uniref:Lipoprotein signal peptidase n=1 Tax=Deferribacter desulfuricans (strain DSM 14783 / JCM 11476 / NBRC 101012 / SSM1) TaxID=639282 RepID=D3PDI2_DEFDS|nr:signal peptidase II [Deferribacter desulfuricans]BAI80655.1 lipoprotein signal peptidase II [Deferribacter desulfuricans SSM1]
MKNKKFLFLTLIIILLDQYTKYIIKTNFELFEVKPIIKGFFNLTYILNPGAAFGFLAKLDESYRQIFFVLITIIAIFIVIYLFVKENRSLLRKISYSLILGGAFGNFIDRLIIGKVVDFLDFYVGSYHWPAFNIADSAISVGIFFLLLDIIFDKRREESNELNS